MSHCGDNPCDRPARDPWCDCGSPSGCREHCSGCGYPPLYGIEPDDGRREYLCGQCLSERLLDGLDLGGIVGVIRDPIPHAIVDVCPCGRRCDVSAWDARAHRGTMAIEGHPIGLLLDMRDCPCGSTRSRIIDPEYAAEKMLADAVATVIKGLSNV